MKKLITLLAFALCLLAPAPAALAAYNPLGDACSAQTSTTTPTPAATKSSACDPSVNGSDPITGPSGILHKAAVIISYIAGVTAVILAIISGFQYITAAGDPQKAASARSVLMGAVIGVLIVLVAQGILQFVLKSL